MTRHPRRYQLSRKKGFQLPSGVISVARPTRYGNPFRVNDPRWYDLLPEIEQGSLIRAQPGCSHIPGQVCQCLPRAMIAGVLPQINHAISPAEAVAFYELMAVDHKRRWRYPMPEDCTGVACWCPLDQACHGDVIAGLLWPEEVTHA